MTAIDGRGFADLVTVRAGAATHQGHHRRVNEDDLLVSEHVYVVADGMGGHAAGDEASAILVDEMRALIGHPVDAVEVNTTLERAAQRVRQLDAGPAGTTVAAAIGVEREGSPYWLVANVGDSRTYRFAGGELVQVSVDHSVVQELVDSGELPAAEARTHPQRHVVTRAVGAPEALEPDFWLLPVQDGDRLVLCSDGLSAEAEDGDIAATLGRYDDAQAAAEALVALALHKGGHDNVTVVVLDARAHADTDEQQTLPRGVVRALRADAEVPAP